MDFISIILFIAILALLAVTSLRWGYDSRTNDDTIRNWK